MKKFPFFYGWIIVGVSFVNLAIVFGIWYSFSVFFVAILKEFGWSRAATAGVFSCFMLIHSLAAVMIGVFIDRLGPRLVFPAAAGIVALGLFATSTIRTLWEFYLWYGILTAFGVCAIGYIAHSMILPKWFDKKRGLAIGLATAGVGLGMQVLVPGTQWVISGFGWRFAYCALALVILLVLIPLNALFQRKDPQEVGQRPDGMGRDLENADPSSVHATPPAPPRQKPIATTLHAALRTKSFWLLAVSFFFAPMAIQGTLIHQVAGVVDKGFSAAQGAFFFGLAGIMGSVGKVAFGYLSDRIGREKAFTLGMASAFFGVTALLLLRPGVEILLYVYALLFGLGYGSMAPIIPARLADLFLGPDFGKILGVLSLSGGTGAAIGVWLSGKIFDLTASYTLSFIVSLTAMTIAIVLFWLAGVASRPPGKASSITDAP